MRNVFAVIFLVVLGGGFLVIAVCVNIWNYRRRAKMTPKERKRDYDDLRIPGDW